MTFNWMHYKHLVLYFNRNDFFRMIYYLLHLLGAKCPIFEIGVKVKELKSLKNVKCMS